MAVASDDAGVVIHAENVKKEYRLYAKPADRVREAISIRKRSFHEVFKALDGISFEVKKGETIGIIGSNGAGKSTLLKIITGVLQQTSGEVTVNGRISALLELGTGFNPEYTGIENIELNGKMMGFSKKEIEIRKQEIIRFADIGEYIHQPVKNYSSGMFARLAFAVAIMIEPEILIVDETLSVGDIFFQNKCFQKFDELKKKGTSVLFVSHDISSVRKMCSKVLWIENGKQMMFDNCNTVCNAYFDSQIQKLNRSIQKNDEETVNLQEIIAAKSSTDKTEFPKIEIAENSLLSDQATIISAFIRNGRGEYSKNLSVGEQCTVGIVVHFNSDLESVIVGVTANNQKGISMFAGNTFISLGYGVNVTSGNTIDFEMTFIVPRVRSGSYEFSPAVALGTQNNHAILTWLHGVIGVDISNDEYEIAEIGVDFTTKIIPV